MDMVLIAEQLGNSVEALPELEGNYKELDTGELRLYMGQALSDQVLQQVEDDLLKKGVVLTDHVLQDGGVVVIRFQKALAPLAIIAIVVGGIFVIGAALLGWQIFKSIQLGVPLWVWIAGGALVLYLLLSTETAKSAGRTTGRVAARAGKAYVMGKAAGGGSRGGIIPPNHQLTMGG